MLVLIVSASGGVPSGPAAAAFQLFSCFRALTISALDGSLRINDVWHNRRRLYVYDSPHVTECREVLDFRFQASMTSGPL